MEPCPCPPTLLRGPLPLSDVPGGSTGPGQPLSNPAQEKPTVLWGTEGPDGDIPEQESQREPRSLRALVSQSEQSQRSHRPQEPIQEAGLPPVPQPLLHTHLSVSGTAICPWPPLQSSPSGSRTLGCQREADLVCIQACYLSQRPFHSWGSHTCMDGHPCERARGPVRKSRRVAQWDGTG